MPTASPLTISRFGRHAALLLWPPSAVQESATALAKKARNARMAGVRRLKMPPPPPPARAPRAPRKRRRATTENRAPTPRAPMRRPRLLAALPTVSATHHLACRMATVWAHQYTTRPPARLLPTARHACAVRARVHLFAAAQLHALLTACTPPCPPCSPRLLRRLLQQEEEPQALRPVSGRVVCKESARRSNACFAHRSSGASLHPLHPASAPRNTPPHTAQPSFRLLFTHPPLPRVVQVRQQVPAWQGECTVAASHPPTSTPRDMCAMCCSHGTFSCALLATSPSPAAALPVWNRNLGPPALEGKDCYNGPGPHVGRRA